MTVALTSKYFVRPLQINAADYQQKCAPLCIELCHALIAVSKPQRPISLPWLKAKKLSLGNPSTNAPHGSACRTNDFEAMNRNETLPAVLDNSLDLQYLASNCPRLRAVYHEALRLRKRDLAFRKVERDTIMSEKLLRGGNFAIVPVCQLHDNKDELGSMRLSLHLRGS